MGRQPKPPVPQATTRSERREQLTVLSSFDDDTDLLPWEKTHIYETRKYSPEYCKVLIRSLQSIRLFHKNFLYLLAKQGTHRKAYRQWVESVIPGYGTKHLRRPYINATPTHTSLSLMSTFVDQPLGKMLYVDYEQYDL